MFLGLILLRDKFIAPNRYGAGFSHIRQGCGSGYVGVRGAASISERKAGRRVAPQPAGSARFVELTGPS